MASNLLVAVQTYNDAGLGLLNNLSPFIFYANKKFKDFDKQYPANLGDTITFSLPTRFVASDSLVATFQPVEQRLQTLSVDKAASVAYDFTAQQLIFNVDERLNEFVREAVNEIGTKVASDVATVALTNTYRSFGDGLTPLNDYQQYAQALANFRNFGAVKSDTQAFVSDVDIPPVVGSGLNEFALDRNNASANSWELGRFSGSNFYTSNLLPVHTAGTVGNLQEELTLTAIDVTGTILTFGGASINEPIALAENDILTFDFPGATNSTGIRFLTFTGHVPCAQLVQARVTADASSDGAGVVIVTVFPALISDITNANANVSQDITPLLGVLNARTAPDHRAGFICSGNPLYLGMPVLPEEIPYPTANSMDPDSGASMRSYYGSQFGANTHGFVNDIIWGKTLVDEYSMRLVYPLSTAITQLTAAYGNYDTIRDSKAKAAKEIIAKARAAEKKAA